MSIEQSHNLGSTELESVGAGAGGGAALGAVIALGIVSTTVVGPLLGAAVGALVGSGLGRLVYGLQHRADVPRSEAQSR